MNKHKYAVFNELNDTYIPLGTFKTEEDAEIAVAEHGLDRELGCEYYIAPCQPVVSKDLLCAFTYEPCDNPLGD